MSTHDDLVAKAAEAMVRHLPDSAYDHGCRFACGYDGSDLDIHLGGAVIAAIEPLIEQRIREARAEGHREGYETARGDLVSGAFIGGPTYEALRESFTGRKIAATAWAEGADAQYAILGDRLTEDSQRNPYNSEAGR